MKFVNCLSPNNLSAKINLWWYHVRIKRFDLNGQWNLIKQNGTALFQIKLNSEVYCSYQSSDKTLHRIQWRSAVHHWSDWAPNRNEKGDGNGFLIICNRARKHLKLGRNQICGSRKFWNPLKHLQMVSDKCIEWWLQKSYLCDSILINYDSVYSFIR